MEENIVNNPEIRHPHILDFLDEYNTFLYLLNSGSVVIEPKEIDDYSIKINNFFEINVVKSELKKLTRQIKDKLDNEIKKAPTVEKKRMVASDKFSELRESAKNIQNVAGVYHHKTFTLKNNSNISSFEENHPDLQSYYNALMERSSELLKYFSLYDARINKYSADELLTHYHDPETEAPSFKNPFAFFHDFFVNGGFEQFYQSFFFSDDIAYLIETVTYDSKEAVTHEGESETLDESEALVTKKIKHELIKKLRAELSKAIRLMDRHITDLQSSALISDFLKLMLIQLKRDLGSIKKSSIKNNYPENHLSVGAIMHYILSHYKSYLSEDLISETVKLENQSRNASTPSKSIQEPKTIKSHQCNSFTWHTDNKEIGIKYLWEKLKDGSEPYIDPETSLENFEKVFSGDFIEEPVKIKWTKNHRQDKRTEIWQPNKNMLWYLFFRLKTRGIINELTDEETETYLNQFFTDYKGDAFKNWYHTIRDFPPNGDICKTPTVRHLDGIIDNLSGVLLTT